MTATLPAGFDFTDPDTNLAGVPYEEFAELRRSQPVFWVEQPEHARAGMSEASGSGYWAVTKHADVLESRRTASSSPAARTASSSATR